MSQISAVPPMCPVCAAGQVNTTRDGDGGYPVEMLLPVAVCPACGWTARLVAPGDLSDPLDVDALATRATRARAAHPEWDPGELHEQVVHCGWNGDEPPTGGQVARWVEELAPPWREMAPTGPDVEVGMTVEHDRVQLCPVGVLPAEPAAPWVGPRAMSGRGRTLRVGNLLEVALDAHRQDPTHQAARAAVHQRVQASIEEIRADTLTAVTARWETAR